jgi:hypothetical protein
MHIIVQFILWKYSVWKLKSEQKLKELVHWYLRKKYSHFLSYIIHKNINPATVFLIEVPVPRHAERWAVMYLWYFQVSIRFD